MKFTPTAARARGACVPALVAVALLTGCATQQEVRDACAEHGGVNAASGNAARKYVACRDGYFRVVR